MRRFPKTGSHVAAAGALAAAAVTMLLVACADHTSTAPGYDPQLSNGVIVSAPVAQPSSGSGRAATVAGAGAAAARAGAVAVVYVSLAPGSVPGGAMATIRNRAAGQSLAVPMVNGGFDPVAMAADVGEELSIEVRGRAGEVLAELSARVPRRGPPRLVRTDPPGGKTDVALSASITVVFSEPVDTASVSGSVRLFRGSAAVAGMVTLSPTGLVAKFLPAAPLVPHSDYLLVITTGVRSLSGIALDSTVRAPFTTGADMDRVATVEVRPGSATIVVGQTLQLTATAKDAAGAVVSGSTITWASGAPGVASVSSTGLVTAGGPGSALISATSEGHAAAATITVEPRLGAPQGRIAFVSDRDGKPQLYVVSADGSGLTRLTKDTASYGGPAWSPDATRIAVVRGAATGAGGVESGEIVVMNADGTGATTVAADGSYPAWSPDGGRIRFMKDIPGGAEVDEVTADGTRTTTLCTASSSSVSFVYGRAWSPDRRTLVFSGLIDVQGDGLTQLYLIDDGCAGMRRLTSSVAATQSFETAPAWSPDGTKIAYWSFGPGPMDTPGNTPILWGVWIIDANGAGTGSPSVRNVRFDNSGYMSVVYGDAMSWSPDGNYLVFSRSSWPYLPDYRRELWITSVSGAEPPSRIGATGVQGRDPAWAPR